MNIDPRMTKARARLIQKQPFFGTLALYLKLVQDEQVETMATNGESLFYATKFIDTLTPNQLEGVIAHEVMHCALQHHNRRGTRDADQWNKACDFSIDPNLLAAGFQLPDDAHVDPQYHNMSADEIFARMTKQKQEQQKGQNQQGSQGQGQPQQGQGTSPSGSQSQPQPAQGANNGQAGSQQGNAPGAKPSPGPGEWGRVLDSAPSHDPAKQGESKAEWDRRVRQALAVAKAHNAGSIPGELQDIAKEINKPKSDWTAGLYRFINDRCNTDYSWNKPNKRLLSLGYVFPGTIPDGINKLGIVIDTSGSVNNHMLGLFLQRVQDCVGEVSIAEVVVVQCDAQVNKVDRFARGEDIKVNVVGRGGTRFSPALDWFEQNEPEVAALIYFTDLECNDFGRDPGMPLIWAVYGFESVVRSRTQSVPFGEIIEVTE